MKKFLTAVLSLTLLAASAVSALAVYNPPAKTGDSVGNSMIIWIGILVLSAVAIAVLLIVRHKNSKK